MTPEFKRAINEAARWGVLTFFGHLNGEMSPETRQDLLLEHADRRGGHRFDCLPPDLRGKRLHLAPASISWVSMKPAFILWDDWTRASEAAQFVHELAHVLVGTNPDDTEEMGALFAIQHEISRRLKLPWLDEVSAYGVSDDLDLNVSVYGMDWGDLTTRARGKLLTRYYAEARTVGLVDANNRATFRRVEPK